MKIGGIKMKAKMVENALGRKVPVEVNGQKEVPFQGIGKHRPEGRKHAPKIAASIDFPDDGNKIVDSLETALKKAGISDNMTISTHHHLRNGDYIANQVFEIASKIGVKNLTWLPSASFPCHEPIIEQLKDGTIDHIEGSMNGPLGKFTSEGNMNGVGILRSHGGRYQAIQDGEVKIDIAVLAAPTADKFGNAHGLEGFLWWTGLCIGGLSIR
jgi:citrate lyase subunit alpha/citrate CoA-transferase